MAAQLVSIRLAELSHKLALAFTACLPFLVPFTAGRNIDMQAYILLIAGGFAWIAVTLRHRQYGSPSGRLITPAVWLLVLFLLACVLSFLINPHKGYDFFGAPYIRLGAAGFLACAGIGLSLRQVNHKPLLTGLYINLCLLALLSVPYSLWRFGTLTRVAGLVAQADVFACLLGTALVAGFGMIRLYPNWRRSLWVTQSLLIVLLLLTQTRAVILITLALLVVYGLANRRRCGYKHLVLCLVGLCAVIIGLRFVQPGRLTDTSFAGVSLDYRLRLQGQALQATVQKPAFGYGLGNLTEALACQNLDDAVLQRTCHDHRYFNSSHNIFLDRVLAVGWLGGLAFLALVLLAVYRGLVSGNKIIAAMIVVIVLYYLTNVTSVVLEVLLWILMIRCLSRASTSP